MKPLEAYTKLDHTCCLNSSTMKYGIITDDETDRDCKDIEEMTDCLDDLEKVVKALEILKKYLHIEYDSYDDTDGYSKDCECINVDIDELNSETTEEEFNLLKEVLK